MKLENQLNGASKHKFLTGQSNSTVQLYICWLLILCSSFTRKSTLFICLTCRPSLRLPFTCSLIITSSVHMSRKQFYYYHLRLKDASRTLLRICLSSAGNRLFVLNLPPTISMRRTPKLYISAFRVNWPRLAYSGAI